MKYRLILIWIIVGLLSLPVCGYCVIEEHEYVERFGCNYINWTRGFIQAKGIGIPTERNAGKDQADMMTTAYTNALQNLLEVVKEVRIDFKTKIRDFSAKSDIMAKIESMLKRSQVVKQQYFSDGSLEVTLQMSLYGGFAQLVLPQEIQQVESIKPVGVNPIEIPFVCCNPYSPKGYEFDDLLFKNKLASELGLQVFNVMKDG